jgi:hypothetical protein
VFCSNLKQYILREKDNIEGLKAASNYEGMICGSVDTIMGISNEALRRYNLYK